MYAPEISSRSDEEYERAQSGQGTESPTAHSGPTLGHSVHLLCNTDTQEMLHFWDFPGGAVVKNLTANAGDTGSSPGLGRSHMPRSN